MLIARADPPTLVLRFPDEQACLSYLERVRWGDGFLCPACGAVGGEWWAVRRGTRKCSACGRETSLTAGTIFHASRLPLRSWFGAIWYVVNQKNGAGALGLLGGGSHQTAWAWLHNPRRAMVLPGREMLAGAIEVDETLMGGVKPGKPGRSADGKALVVIAVECHDGVPGRARMRRISHASADVLTEFGLENFARGSEVRTDGWKGYKDIGRHRFQHVVTNLSGSDDPAHMVMPEVHPVASLLKRSGRCSLSAPPRDPLRQVIENRWSEANSPFAGKSRPQRLLRDPQLGRERHWRPLPARQQPDRLAAELMDHRTVDASSVWTPHPARRLGQTQAIKCPRPRGHSKPITASEWRLAMNENANRVEPPENGGGDHAEAPVVVDRAAFQSELDALRVREKAHTREGDAIAAARRRLPMVEVDATIPVIGPQGPVALLDVFDGRRQLMAYYFMWSAGKPAPEQCEGCTLYTSHVRERSYLHSRDVTYATFCQGPYESVRYRDFMGWEMPWYSVQDSAEALLGGRRVNRFYLICYLRRGDRVFETYWTNGRGVEPMGNGYRLLDLTVYGRQESWEDSPAGWPQPWGPGTNPYRTDGDGRPTDVGAGRPIAQWSRLEAGRSDDIRTAN